MDYNNRFDQLENLMTDMLKTQDRHTEQLDKHTEQLGTITDTLTSIDSKMGVLIKVIEKALDLTDRVKKLEEEVFKK